MAKEIDVNSKFLIDAKEYERLKNIEELYLKSQAKIEKNLQFARTAGKKNSMKLFAPLG
jgi:PHD/YefM family antitoxin component YafN of YafNO toxin-antitoxin module